MKICILTPRFPFPQYGGDALRIYVIARYLKAQGHYTILVSFTDDTPPDIQAAKEVFDEVHTVQLSKWQSRFGSLWYLLRRRPMQCGYYHSSKYLRTLRNVIARTEPDLYIAQLLRMTPYIEALRLEQQCIVEMTDALSKTYSLSNTAKGGGILKYVYAFERQLIKRYEQQVIHRFRKVVLVSWKEIDYLNAVAGEPCTSLAMYTMGTELLQGPRQTYDTDKICFIGCMRSLQNQDAVLFFVRDIFPLIKNWRPAAKFYIVGSLPPPSIQRLASDDIIVTGFVDDLHEAVADAAVCVVPVRVAAGIQNKILIGMASHVPVVLTSLVSQGIPELRDGDNCLIRDNATEIATACLELMNDPCKRNSLGEQGYEMVRQYYSWDNQLRGYEDFDDHGRH